MTHHIEIRMLTKVEEIEPIMELEKVVWKTDVPMPADQMVTAAKHGGMVLGAFLDDRLIGFQYSFAGFDGKQAYLCSHMLGTHPDYRYMKIGEKLKWKQREIALTLGYDRITWTYDPLETANGYLNIHKLGAVCSTYIENCYGNMQDSLNRGISSDRFQVDWHIRSQRVVSRAEGEQQQYNDVPDSLLFDWKQDENGYPVPAAEEVDWGRLEGTTMHLPVPAQFQQMKKQNKSLAIQWRTMTHHAFTYLFERDWIVTDLIRNEKTTPVHFYVLHRKGEDYK
ncbi:GNAT family N-acetyltransferase [Aneurinibacillus migulanus]|uniref:Predicted acetyltransferase, GNAT superfamily n=1 Tax=Aneurinibacillus migulanus TaxID=47500 RepID=A0A0D1YKG8_ANEMI|nr:GNAT family N-acetyltransferase [Aneurinibacillus migulanus]KIV59262.1 hypothetical protein TS65_03240 [Aneurinibacillus migulanus]KON92783.1 hypothetical protein AF333_27035 [Aneurinibacillus migulanus]MED0895578.1 GNAT family N-acetyltransferase [Aneurinibacillus migulanus]MED1617655.1 GNAT family N-acetyltransferase [Aneurinibacillus migulanus]MED4731860.1 GNAT family N-acetyltransferase [Aneurinibacillus migulanus]